MLHRINRNAFLLSECTLPSMRKIYFITFLLSILEYITYVYSNKKKIANLTIDYDDICLDSKRPVPEGSGDRRPHKREFLHKKPFLF